jgi:hypothetical protein
MVRKSLLAVVVIALIAGVSAQAPVVLADAPAALSMPPDRSADSYAIYSLLMPGEPFSAMSPDQNQRWAIADTTVSIADMNPAIPPEGQLKAPEEHPRGFHEAVRDYEARKYQHIQLTEQFQLNQPYSLLTADQVTEFRKARASIDPGSALQAKYAGYPGITFFSQVFFSSNHNAALVYMNNWCTNLCATGQWVYLEKHGGQWVRRSGIYKSGA